MTRTTGVVGYAVLLAAFVAYQVAALVTPRWPTMGQAASSAFRRRPVLRYAVLAVWLWIGWHLFVR